MNILAAIATTIFVISLPVSAQRNPESDPESQEADQQGADKEGRKGFWEANVSGGNYVVALSRISSVSRHQYILDGALIVTEVTIDTEGQALARFYYLQPITDDAAGTAIAGVASRTLGLIEEAAEGKGSNMQNMVVKKYPLTTHSKTIEYRLLSEAQLNVLYSSVKTAWQTGRGRIFSGR